MHSYNSGINPNNPGHKLSRLTAKSSGWNQTKSHSQNPPGVPSVPRTAGAVSMVSGISFKTGDQVPGTPIEGQFKDMMRQKDLLEKLQ